MFRKTNISPDTHTYIYVSVGTEKNVSFTEILRMYQMNDPKAVHRNMDIFLLELPLLIT